MGKWSLHTPPKEGRYFTATTDRCNTEVQPQIANASGLPQSKVGILDFFKNYHQFSIENINFKL